MVKTLERDRYALCKKHFLFPFCCSYQMYRYLAGCFGLISCRHYLVNMLMKCTAAEIDSFRGILWAIYRNAQRGDFLASDIHAMHSLITELEQKKSNEELPEDRIIRLQITLLIQNLHKHIQQIS